MLYFGAVTTFLEDKDMIEARQKVPSSDNLAGLVHVNPDATQLQARRILGDFVLQKSLNH